MEDFLSAYTLLYVAGLKVDLLDALNKYSGSSIIFTGHSLGGALASYAALRFT